MAVHESFLADPQVAAMLGQTPTGQQTVAALKAHIAEHMAFLYRQQMEEKIGAPLPVPNAELPEEQAAQLASLMASAGQQLTQQKQAQAQQAAAQQKAEDPVFQMAQRELAIKEQDAQRKAA